MQVSYLPLSVIITTFKKENVKRPLEGFGVLVPSKEQQNGLKTLGNVYLLYLMVESLILFSHCDHKFSIAGTLFSSMMFPDRAPNDLYLYTTFIGGSRNRELAKASTYVKLQCFWLYKFDSCVLHLCNHFIDYHTSETVTYFSQLIQLLNGLRDELKQTVTSDLRQLLGVEGEPTFVKYGND